MTKYSIPPNVAAILMLAYSSLGLLSVPVLQALGFTTDAATIYAWATLLGGVLGIALHLFSSTAPGVLAPQDDKAAPAPAIPAVKVTLFLVACLMAGAMIPGHAHAGPDTREALASPFTPFTPPKTAGGVVNSINSVVTGTTSALTGTLEGGGPLSELASLLSSDNASAIALSTVVPAIQDGNGQACWRAAGAFTAAVKAHPIPVTLKLMTDIEGFRIATIAAEQLCSNPACTQVFAELANGVSQMGVGIPVVSLASICAKVPHIAVVPPTAAPVTAPVTAAPSTAP